MAGMPEMHLSIYSMSGTNVAVVRAVPSDTVRSVKKRIEDEEGTPSIHQQLLRGHSVLRSRLTLEECGITSDTCLQMVRSIPEEPSMPAASGRLEILQEDRDELLELTEDDVDEFAEWLGMDIEEDYDLIWIAEAALRAALPPQWRPCQTPEGEIFYFNFETGDSTWDHPCDDQYRKIYKLHKMMRLQADETIEIGTSDSVLTDYQDDQGSDVDGTEQVEHPRKLMDLPCRLDRDYVITFKDEPESDEVLP